MRRYASVALVIGALVATTIVLTTAEGDRRTWGFRAVVAAIGFYAVRSLAT